MIELFISHHNQDAKLAEVLINFLRDALSLKPQTIRCTSVEGYRLPAGSHTESRLRAEIVDATYFIALITPVSLKSPWVLIELGARWATEKPLMPLLAKGAIANTLKGPIASLNALRCDKEANMQQLVSEMAKEFGDDPPQPSVYRKTLNPLLNLAKPLSTSFTPSASSSINESPLAKALLDDAVKRKLGF
jgi:TIR domain